MSVTEVGTPDQALAEAVRRCAMHGDDWLVINADKAVVWEIEADTKVDDDDLTFPVIVHMRGGTLSTDSIAVLVAAKELAG